MAAWDGQINEGGNSGMERLIQMVNQLQDASTTNGLPFGLELPQIVVVGGQSAGKSSVLENFVGKDFLPRGAGIVTRRPLVLQLIHAQTEYAEFLHCPGRRFTNFDEVRREIEAETDRETGSNKGISRRPINLRVYSPNVLDLTLVDLPGMTRVAVGNQPADIEHQIREMVLEFARSEKSLILAVSPANSDLANSDAMRIAKEVDPTGKRTIGVITKLDLMDKGTDAREILLNQLLPLKIGYIGVVNRSQRDIEGQKNIREAMRAELQFFQTHESYRDLCERMGTLYLQKVLNRELARHIQETLPKIRNTLRTRMLEIKNQLKGFPDVSTPDLARQILSRILDEFSEYVETQIQGLNADIDKERLGGGARINQIFYNEFADNLNLKQVTGEVMKRKVAFTIRNISGFRNAIFTPDMAFHATVMDIIPKFKDPLKVCVRDVATVLDVIIQDAADTKLKDYPRLKEEALFMTREYIQEQEATSEKYLLTHVDAETAFMNTRHEDFIRTRTEDPCPGASEFTQSLNSVKKKIENSAKGIQRGWLEWKCKGMACWFSLTTYSLTAFANEKEEEVHFSMHLNNKVKLMARADQCQIFLFNCDKKDVILGHRLVELSCEDAQDTQLWVDCFATAGVHTEETGQKSQPASRKISVRFDSTASTTSEQNGVDGVTRRVNNNLVRQNRQTLRDFTKSMLDPDMDKQIEVIKMMSESYLTIVGKTIRDIAPKYIMHHLVLRTQKFVTSEMKTRITIENDPMELVKGDPQQIDERESLEEAYKKAEQALQIIAAAQQ